MSERTPCVCGSPPNPDCERCQLVAERDELSQYKTLFDDALDCVDRVFQKISQQDKPPLLPDFLMLGESKFKGVIKLAEAYLELKAENERLKAELAESERLRAECVADSVEDDAEIRLACKRVLPAEAVDGTPDSTPDNVTLVEMLVAENERLRARAADLQAVLEQVNALAREYGYGQGELDEDLAGCLRRIVERQAEEKRELLRVARGLNGIVD